MPASPTFQEAIDRDIFRLEDALRRFTSETEHSLKPSAGAFQNEASLSTESQRMIDTYTADIRALRTQRNTYSFISILPDDLFHNIFVQIKLDVVNNPEDDRGGWSNWLLVNGVCKRWRQIALNTPRLWSHITLSRLDRAEEMFKRSKGCPKRYTCDLGYSSVTTDKQFWAIAETAMSDMQVVRTLDLKGGYPHDTTRFLELATVERDSALKLEALYLAVPSYRREPRLRKTFFWTNLPSLQHLRLIDVFIPEELPLLPSLALLQVVKVSDPYGHLSVQWVVQNLPKVPNVKHLSLDMIGTEADSFAHIRFPDGNISLPSLQKLFLHCYDSRHTLCLDHIDFPGSTIAEVYAAHFCAYHSDENLQPIYNLWKQASVKYIDLEIDDENTTITLYDTISSLEQSNPHMTFQLFALQDEEDVAWIDGGLPLSEITSLTLGHRMRGLHRLLPLLHGVTTLNAIPCDLKYIAKCIEVSLSKNSRPLPAFRVLNVDLWEIEEIAPITLFVKRCKGLNMTIPHIHLTSRHTSMRTWDVLKLESLTHVEWRPKHAAAEGVGNTL